MATIEKVVIAITADVKGVPSTLTSLKKIGKVEEKNAKIFASAAQKRAILLKGQLKALATLERKQKQAFEPGRIKILNKAIKTTNERIELLGGKIKKVDQASDKFGGTLGKLGKIVLGAFAVGAIVSFTKHLFSLAVESEVFRKRAKIVFGESLEIVEEFAEKGANALGLTAEGFLGAAAAIGDILVPLGLSRKRAAELSVEAVKLGGALREFTGDSRSAAEISNIVAKSLTGETEGLKQLGVVVDQTSKQFKDLVLIKQADLGLTKQQAKAEAIFQIAIESSADALKAFEENGNSLVRQQAELEAKSAELEETLATLLTPAFLALTTEANKSVTVLNKIVKTEASLLAKFLAVAQATGALGGVIIDLSAETETLTEHTKEHEEAEEDVRKVQETRIKTIGDLKLELQALRIAQDDLIPSSKALAINQARIRIIQSILKAEVSKSITPFEVLTKRVSELRKELQNQALAGDIDTDTIKELNAAVKQLIVAELDLQIALTGTLDPMEAQALALEKIGKNSKSATDLILEFEQIQRDEIEETLNKRLDAIERASEAQSSAFAIESQINTNRLIDIDNREARALKRLDAEILGEEELAEKQLEIQQKASEERARILTKQAQADKRAAIFDATINLSVAVTKALANTANPIFAALIAGLAAAELAVIASQPIPEFHEGKKPELGSGEMYAKILKSESVIPPKQSAENKDLIDSMIDGNLKSYVFKQYQLPLIQKMAKEQPNLPFDDMNIWTNQKKQIRLMQQGNSLTQTLIRSLEPGNRRRSWR